MSHDFALVQDEDGLVTAHKPDCIMVDKARRNGAPILTMFDCQHPLGKAYRKHSCLKEDADAVH